MGGGGERENTKLGVPVCAIVSSLTLKESVIIKYIFYIFFVFPYLSPINTELTMINKNIKTVLP